MKGQYKDEYKETNIIDVTNKILNLAHINDKNIPYSEYSKFQLRLFDTPGKGMSDGMNVKLFSDMKALFILFDITNENTYNTIDKKIESIKNIFEKSIKNDENENILKQPKSFEEIPLLIIGNKSDLETKRKIKKIQAEKLVHNLKEKNKFSFIKYHEISIKEDKGIENILEEIILYYFKRKFDVVVRRRSTVKGRLSKDPKNMKDDKEKEKEKEKEKKKPSLDKNLFIYHQMLVKFKKKILIEVENSKNEYEKELKNKNEQIENMKKKLEDLVLSTKKKISLIFKIPNKDIKDEIVINTKGETKVYDVINMLYELCPSINDLNIKGFCLEGKENEIIDEMKTVNENKLVNGSLISLIL
jgi:signal recognition particle receptor subunit beta